VVEPQLAPLAAAYVLVMAIVGPVALRFLDQILDVVLRSNKKKKDQPAIPYVPPPKSDAQNNQQGSGSVVVQSASED